MLVTGATGTLHMAVLRTNSMPTTGNRPLITDNCRGNCLQGWDKAACGLFTQKRGPSDAVFRPSLGLARCCGRPPRMSQNVPPWPMRRRPNVALWDIRPSVRGNFESRCSRDVQTNVQTNSLPLMRLSDTVSAPVDPTEDGSLSSIWLLSHPAISTPRSIRTTTCA